LPRARVVGWYPVKLLTGEIAAGFDSPVSIEDAVRFLEFTDNDYELHPIYDSGSGRTDYPPQPVISIKYTTEDVRGFAEEAGIDLDTALDRAYDWADAITQTASGIISEQLYDVVRYNEP